MVILMTQPHCPNCKGVKEILERNNIVYEEQDVRTPENLAICKEHGFTLLPIIGCNGKYINNTLEDVILEFIGGNK